MNSLSINWHTESSFHYSDVVMGTVTSQFTSFTIVYPTVYLGADQRKHQSSASLAFVREFTGDHKGPVTRKMLPFDEVIMVYTGNYAHDSRYRLFTKIIRGYFTGAEEIIWLSHSSEKTTNIGK